MIKHKHHHLKALASSTDAVVVAMHQLSHQSTLWGARDDRWIMYGRMASVRNVVLLPRPTNANNFNLHLQVHGTEMKFDGTPMSVLASDSMGVWYLSRAVEYSKFLAADKCKTARAPIITRNPDFIKVVFILN